jgi:hypothetical protein
VSKTWEHYHHAARQHEKAAYHFNEAAKYNQAEEYEKAAHYAYLAHGHSQHAVHHDVEGAKLNAKQCDGLVTPVPARAVIDSGTRRAMSKNSQGPFRCDIPKSEP